MKKLIELLNKPNSKVAIVVEDGTIVTTEDTAQGLLEQLVIYAELDAAEGWENDLYRLDVYVDNEEVYSYHHCTSSAETLVKELEEVLIVE